MDLVPFLKAISSVTNPLTLIAFIVVALIAVLLLVLKFTNGLARVQELFFKYIPADLFVKIFTIVMLVFLAITTMLFALLAHDYNTNLEKQKLEKQTRQTCYGEECKGRPPRDAGCDKGVELVTSTLVKFPELGEEFKNFYVEMKYSPKCNASWIKAPQVKGATIYFEDKEGKRYQSLKIDPFINEPQVTNMFFRNIESRGCIEYPGKKSECTDFVSGHN